jgi:tRNA-splicing ligase RtcB (3'-phosphate/5'-hydroxy nucleic acid ligase)
MTAYDVIATEGVPIKAWTPGVTVEAGALRQLRNVATLPFVHPHVAAMPDVHAGIGATIGSVIPCRRAIIPAAVGVDIGCGMMAVQTNLTSQQLPENLHGLRSAIETAVPHGRTAHGKARVDRGAWGTVPDDVAAAWTAARAGGTSLAEGLGRIVAGHPKLAEANSLHHLGTLGTGNHFIEVCLDEGDRVWAMLHSGSRGIGNAIGRTFIALAKRDMERHAIHLPDVDLAYFPEETEHFAEYVAAVHWAQAFAQVNRKVMMARVLRVMAEAFPGLEWGDVVVDCHHNYVEREKHFGEALWVTRKGAVSARRGELGIIPGSMGARSHIVRGLGEAQSFCSCAHGAGRAMSRTEARRRFSVADHERATAGVECRKDAHVLDETPMAYKDIDAVMAAQADLVEIVHTLKQIVCVKG